MSYVYSKSLKTKQRIYDAAMDLFIRNGYANTSLKEVAQAAGVSMGTIYRYFPKKGDFFAEIGYESTARLRDFVENLPEDLPVAEAILAVLMEDVRGNLEIFFRQVEKNGRTIYEPNDLRGAYYGAYAMNADHFANEMFSRAQLARIYQGLLEKAVARGELLCSDCAQLGEIIAAIFFQEDDKSAFTVDYPYEEVFRRKIATLLEGKLLR